jgi:hypothetical protein
MVVISPNRILSWFSHPGSSDLIVNHTTPRNTAANDQHPFLPRKQPPCSEKSHSDPDNRQNTCWETSSSCLIKSWGKSSRKTPSHQRTCLCSAQDGPPLLLSQPRGTALWRLCLVVPGARWDSGQTRAKGTSGGTHCRRGLRTGLETVDRVPYRASARQMHPGPWGTAQTAILLLLTGELPRAVDDDPLRGSWETSFGFDQECDFKVLIHPIPTSREAQPQKQKGETGRCIGPIGRPIGRGSKCRLHGSMSRGW